MTPLPRIMLAPNGARKGKADHPRLPVTIPDLIAETRLALDAGADGLHAHIRDAQGGHSLDAGLYRELLAETDRAFPGLFVQITTESAGIYDPAQQRALVREVKPRHVSIGLREVMSDGETGKTADLLAFCAGEGIEVQHILYDEEDCRAFLRLRRDGVIPEGPAQILHVLGRYTEGQNSDPADVARRAKAAAGPEIEWGLCAFGRNETACLIETIRLGGKARIGFENNLFHPDGSLAESNAARVGDLVARLQDLIPEGAA